MYLRDLFLASAIVAVSLGSIDAVAGEEFNAGKDAVLQQGQALKPYLADSRALIRPVAEGGTAAGRGEPVPALVSTVQNATPAKACRMPGSPARTALPYCAPASTLMPAESDRPVMVW